MRDKIKIFRAVFARTLDYADGDFIKHCAKWGLDTYDLLNQHERILATADAGDEGHFIYAVTLARIVGEFGKLAFGDFFSDEAKILLHPLGLHFEDIECYLEEDMGTEHREELRHGNYVKAQDVWSSMQELKTEIHRSLVVIYRDKEEKDPILVIFVSLMKIFEMSDEKTSETMTPDVSTSRETAAYAYVDQWFL